MAVFKNFALKVHWWRFENLSISLSSYEINMLKIWHYYFSRYAHVRSYTKCLFTITQKQ